MTTTTMAAQAAGANRIHAARRVVDPRQRFAEIMIAALFIACAAVSIPAAFLLDPILNAMDYLSRAAANQSAITASALLWSINNVGLVFIAVFAFPILRRLDEFAAVGYLAMRIVEGAVMMVGIAATLLLVPLSEAFITAGAPDGAWFQTIGDILRQLRLLGLTELSLPLLGLGGMLFTSQLFRFRLVPNVIALTGLVGYALIFFGGLASWFDIVDAAPGGNATFLAVPVAVFEIILLPFWLFAKGFRMPATTRT